MRALALKLAVPAAALAFLLTAPAGAFGAAGQPDPSFGTGGFTILDEPSEAGEQLLDLVLLPDGRILAGGQRGGNPDGFLLARFTPSGTPDLSFGTGGITVTAGGTREIDGLDTQADGKIVAAGLGDGGGANGFAIARYTADGSTLDPGFNGGAPVILKVGGLSSDAFDVAAAPGDKVVAVGIQVDVSTFTQKVALVRRAANGMPDTTFNGTGELAFDVPGTTSEEAEAVRVLPDGSMIVAGDSDQGLFVLKLTEGGIPDSTFGNGGLAVHDVGTASSPSGTPFDIQVLPDGRILVTGSSSSPQDDDQLFLARFTSHGDFDPTFGSGGLVLRNPTVHQDSGQALATLPDGRIVVAGLRNASIAPTSDTWVLRFTANGVIDPSFGSGGETVASAASDDWAWGMALDPLGRAVTAGSAFDGSYKLLVGRFLGDPAPSAPPPVATKIPVLDPDLHDLELVGKRLTPFTVGCAMPCSADVLLRSRARQRLPHISAVRRAFVTLGRAKLAGGISGRRTVRLSVAAQARAIVERRPIASNLSVTTITAGGVQKATRTVRVRAAQSKLVLNADGRGRLRVIFRAEANPAVKAVLRLKLGRRIAAQARFSPTPGRSHVIALHVRAPGVGIRGQVMKLTLSYRLDTGARARTSRRLLVVPKR